MKFCPTCQTRYDEEILRFCTKDGTPLVEENQPVFTELPSESAAEDFEEQTVIRRNPPAPKAEVIDQTQPLSAPRIVIPTTAGQKEQEQQQVRARTTTVYQTVPRKTNTGKIVLLTLLGTFIILGIFGLLFLMTRERSNNADNNANQIINVNTGFNAPDANLNTNFNLGNSSLANFNSNFNAESNINKNVNANLKTPTPSPTATRPPILNSNINFGNSNVNSSNSSNVNSASPTPTPKPTATPTLPPPPPPKSSPSNTTTPTPSNRPVNAGVLNGRAVNLPKPAYPPLAKQMRASGQVAVQVIVDENGNVTAAKATNGNTLLRAPAEAAARQSKISPIKINDRAVQVVGILLYNFINQ